MDGLARRRDTCGLRVGKKSLRAVGLRSKLLGLIAVRVGRPMDWKSAFDDLGPLDGEHIFADLALFLCYQMGRQSPLSAHHPMLWVRTQSLFPDPVALLRQP